MGQRIEESNYHRQRRWLVEDLKGPLVLLALLLSLNLSAFVLFLLFPPLLAPSHFRGIRKMVKNESPNTSAHFDALDSFYHFPRENVGAHPFFLVLFLWVTKKKYNLFCFI